jgi:hypothetical protein
VKSAAARGLTHLRRTLDEHRPEGS